VSSGFFGTLGKAAALPFGRLRAFVHHGVRSAPAHAPGLAAKARNGHATLIGQFLAFAHPANSLVGVPSTTLAFDRGAVEW
jgi:hypothetical protein